MLYDIVGETSGHSRHGINKDTFSLQKLDKGLGNAKECINFTRCLNETLLNIHVLNLAFTKHNSEAAI